MLIYRPQKRKPEKYKFNKIEKWIINHRIPINNIKFNIIFYIISIIVCGFLGQIIFDFKTGIAWAFICAINISSSTIGNSFRFANSYYYKFILLIIGLVILIFVL